MLFKHYKLPRKGEEVSFVKLSEILHHYDEVDLWVNITTDRPKKLFSSDGCTCWPDNFGKRLRLYEACFLHDIPYWAGYPMFSLKGWINRLKADIKLTYRVIAFNSWKVLHWSIPIALLMFVGVRIGGIWWVGIKKAHWGFGRKEK